MLNKKFLICAFLCLGLCSCGKAGESAPLEPPSVSDIADSETNRPDDTIWIDHTASGDIDITTPYVTLKYPEKWLNFLKTEKIYSQYHEENLTKIVFYSQVGEREKMPIFSIHFNEDGEFYMGSLDNSGDNVYISFSYSELVFDGQWTEEEKNIVYAMQEDINYISDCLKNVSGFDPET